MAALTTQQVALTGTAITYAAATASTGDTFVADDRTVVRIKNGSGSPITCTISIGLKGPGATTIGPLPGTIAAGAEEDFGPVPSAFNDPTTGLTTVVCSAVTTVTIAATRS